MATDDAPRPNPFGEELKARRLGLNLSVRAAATRAGMGSHARWTQVEQGYVSVKGEKIRTEAGEDFVIKAARAVKWDIPEALRKAGYDPDTVHIPESVEDTPPRTLEDLWVKLNDQQRAVIYNLARIMVDPDAIVDPQGRTAETQNRPVPRVLFSAEEDTKDTGR
ncbi:hypothetical protein AB0383_20135 [Amycolatopsis sp. NPDC051373]|uniref:hypothetical protein n=1 Tax=Amycolatopsis sp. NPDC051373 TaxID=3155801 RepID=UPI00344B3DA2